jgi:peptide/nickel transport system ATP-binding protein/oligopeptide transport system ATP-binding protein
LTAAAVNVEVGETLLDVRDLVVEFPGGLRAADGVSFEIRAGEVFGLVGESGSGKSTVVRSLIGLLPPSARLTRGQVVFRGQDVVGLPERRLRSLRGAQIAMVFQDPLTSLNPVLTVEVQISEGLRWHSDLGAAERRRRVLEVMSLVGLPDRERLLRAYPFELSGGLRQRVALALALVSEPSLLLADEPTTALDVTIQDQILKLLVSLRDRLAMSVVLVTHDLGVVAQTCQRVGVMYAGRIVETGSVQQIFDAPSHPYTRALLDSIPRGALSAGRLTPIAGSPPDLDELPAGCRFSPRCRFVEPKCTVTDPSLIEHAPDHASACLRRAEIQDRLRD